MSVGKEIRSGDGQMCVNRAVRCVSIGCLLVDRLADRLSGKVYIDKEYVCLFRRGFDALYANEARVNLT